MTRSTRSGLLLWVLALLAAGCGDDAADPTTTVADTTTTTTTVAETTTTEATTTTEPPPATGVVVDVEIRGFTFVPAEVTVNVGDAVRWTNFDSIAHTTTSRDGFWSRTLTDEPFEFVTTMEGRFEYICTIHPAEMQAVLIVEEGA
jgi:plastocyanin